jgi:hypothetical protein
MQLVKKLPAFHGSRMFIKARKCSFSFPKCTSHFPVLSQMQYTSDHFPFQDPSQYEVKPAYNGFARDPTFFCCIQLRLTGYLTLKTIEVVFVKHRISFYPGSVYGRFYYIFIQLRRPLFLF